jgi:hypothetical protein
MDVRKCPCAHPKLSRSWPTFWTLNPVRNCVPNSLFPAEFLRTSIFDENFSDWGKPVFLWSVIAQNLCLGVGELSRPCPSQRNSTSIFTYVVRENAFSVALCAHQLGGSCRNGNLQHFQSKQPDDLLLQQNGETERCDHKK